MRPTARRWIAILAVAGVSALCWTSLARPRHDRTSSGANLPSTWNRPPAPLPAVDISPTMPRASVAVAAQTHAARTHLLAVLPAGSETLVGPEVVDDGSIAIRGSVLAYRILAGLDPADNSLETHDLETGQSWRVEPDEGGVVFGFSLDPEGTRLAYLEVDARLSGTQPPWRVVVVDLATGRRWDILDSSQHAEAFLPVDWQGNTILFRAVVPFTFRYRGLWTARADGSDLRPVLPEADFVGNAHLSPDGDRLAVLRTDPQAVPSTFGPGEPPATELWVVDLQSGEEFQVAAADVGSEFADLLWDVDGLVTLVGTWDEETLVYLHRRVIAFAVETGASPRAVYSIDEGEVVRLVGCPRHHWMAIVQSGEGMFLLQGRPTETVARFPLGELAWGACPAAESAGDTMGHSE